MQLSRSTWRQVETALIEFFRAEGGEIFTVSGESYLAINDEEGISLSDLARNLMDPASGGDAVMTLGSHQRAIGLSQAHVTPKWIIEATGPYDLDPCAADPRPWPCARTNWTTDGLNRPWPRECFIYLNPPFDRYEVGD